VVAGAAAMFAGIGGRSPRREGLEGGKTFARDWARLRGTGRSVTSIAGRTVRGNRGKRSWGPGAKVSWRPALSAASVAGPWAQRCGGA